MTFLNFEGKTFSSKQKCMPPPSLVPSLPKSVILFILSLQSQYSPISLFSLSFRESLLRSPPHQSRVLANLSSILRWRQLPFFGNDKDFFYLLAAEKPKKC